jgi:hypothetical protein
MERKSRERGESAMPRGMSRRSLRTEFSSSLWIHSPDQTSINKYLKKMDIREEDEKPQHQQPGEGHIPFCAGTSFTPDSIHRTHNLWLRQQKQLASTSSRPSRERRQRKRGIGQKERVGQVKREQGKRRNGSSQLERMAHWHWQLASSSIPNFDRLVVGSIPFLWPG